MTPILPYGLIYKQNIIESLLRLELSLARHSISISTRKQLQGPGAYPHRSLIELCFYISYNITIGAKLQT